MRSSGQYVTSRDLGRECDAEDDDGLECRWEGTVEVDWDPETQTYAWECPACGTDHEEAT